MKSYLAQKPSRYPTARLCSERLLRAIQALVAKDLPGTESSNLCCTQCIGISRGFLNPLSLALLLLAFQSAYAQSESAYVIDQLLVGVHADKNLDSAIIKVLPTGTQLEILERDGELARVRDRQGDTGWIDAAYLMASPPAREMLARLEQANSELKIQLENAASGGGNGTPAVTGDSAAVDELTKENTELKRKLSSEKIANTKLTEQLNTAQSRLGDRPLSAAETQVVELEKTVTDLKRELESTLQANKLLEEQQKRPLSEAVPKIQMDGISWPLVIAGVVLILLAYGGGLYTMDYLNRRRHGGFRV